MAASQFKHHVTAELITLISGRALRTSIQNGCRGEVTIKYNKQKLREIDRRIRFLRKTLEDIKVVEYHPQQEGKVFFGAWVELEDDDVEAKTPAGIKRWCVKGITYKKP